MTLEQFLKSDGDPILHASLVSALLEAILLLEKIAIGKRTQITKILFQQETPGQIRLRRPRQRSRQKKQSVFSETNSNVSSSLQSMQSFASGPEKHKWRQSGCIIDNGVLEKL